MPFSFIIYGSVGVVALTILFFLFSKKKNK